MLEKNPLKKNLLGWLNWGSVNVDSRRCPWETGTLWAEVFWYSFSCYFFLGGFLKGQVFLTILWGFSCRIQFGLKMMMRETNEVVQAVGGMVVICGDLNVSQCIYSDLGSCKKRSTLSIQHHMSIHEH